MCDKSEESSLRRAKKMDKKHRKRQHVVEKEMGVVCSLEPTKILAICNAGLVNGLSEEIVVENFIKYGPIKSVLMIPGKSCCILEYNQLGSSVKAFENTNGKLNIAQGNKPIFLSYINFIPELLQPINQTEMPPGLIVIKNFITEDEEAKLLMMVKFDEEDIGSSLKNRLVKHYGYEFRYDISNVDKDRPLKDKIPEQCDFLWERLKTENHLEFKPNQLTVNHYKPGHGIPSHVDTHSAFEDPLLSLSLGSGIVMEFKHQDGRHYPVFLPQRSLVIMSQESRYNWTHGIVPRKMDVVPSKDGLTVFHRTTRTSFTFRKVRLGECSCIYKSKCDSYLRKKSSHVIDNNIAAQLERTHVHNVYENIADHFSNTRHKPWPNVLEFVNSLKVGSILVDVGCGNGKYLGINKNIFEIGCDRSFGLINVCNTRGFECFTCNCLNIPLKDNVADSAISIAVIHHLATEERRLIAVNEIVRILKPCGTALIYVWARDQCREDKSTYIKQDRKNRKSTAEVLPDQKSEKIKIEGVALPVHINRKQFQQQDMLVPWKLKKEDKDDNTFLRFYHVFEEGELEELCSKIEKVKIKRSYYDQGNWCVVIEKIRE